MPASFQWERLFVVVSSMADKDIAGVLEPLVRIATDVIVTSNHSPRAAPVETMAEAARTLGVEPAIVADVPAAVHHAIGAARESDAVLITGSLYTVGDARAVLAR